MKSLAKPFEGRDYQSHPHFPGRLLVLGESAYLTEEDRKSDFTVNLVQAVVRNGRTWRGHITYFKKLFFVLTGTRSREVSDARWHDLWNSLAFYHFVQTPLNRPRERPAEDAWKTSVEPFLRILRELRPNLILMTGKQLAGYICRVIDARVVDDSIIQIPVTEDGFAWATCIAHPSSWGFRVSEAHSRFKRLVSQIQPLV